ncbi:glycoprotease family-domain-containing protein, partial [Geopyxis carbonaria]
MPPRLRPHLPRRPVAPRRPPHRTFTVLGIETSCDDTSVALLRLPSLSSTASSAPPSLLFHATTTSPNRDTGGIHPVIAANGHVASLPPLLSRALALAPAPDLIAVTRGPGMHTCLTHGLDVAKGLALALQKPLVGVHHMQAHLLTPFLTSALRVSTQRPPRWPCATLLVSGGHTQLLRSHSATRHAVVADTLDIALGDFLDKAARVILPAAVIAAQPAAFSFAAALERFVFPPDTPPPPYYAPGTPRRKTAEAALAAQWNFRLGVPLVNRPHAEARAAFSFAGLGSSVERYAASRGLAMTERERRVLGREVMAVAFEHVAARVVYALRDVPYAERGAAWPGDLVVSGGVAQSKFLRVVLLEVLRVGGLDEVRVLSPVKGEFAGDNAAMVAWAGAEMWRAGWRTELTVKATRKWSLDEGWREEGVLTGGGVLGLGGWVR